MLGEWFLSVALSLGIVFGFFIFLKRTLGAEYSRQWFLQALIIVGYIHFVIRKHLSFNIDSQSGRTFGKLGAGTWLTILRGVLLASLAGFLFLPWPGFGNLQNYLSWLPGVLYLVAVLADYLDGYVARRTNHQSVLGRILDIRFDALGMLIAPLLAILYGQIPFYYFSVSIGYYFIQFVRRMRERRGRPLYPIHPRPSAKWFAGAQMVFVGVALLPLFSPPATSVSAIVFMLPELYEFLRDYLIMTGSRKKMISRLLNKFIRIVSDNYNAFILIIRTILVFFGMRWLFLRFYYGSASADEIYFFSACGSLGYTMLIPGLAVLLIGLGVFSRIAALILIFVVALAIALTGSDFIGLYMLIASEMIVLFGPGSWVLFRKQRKPMLL